MGAIKCEKNLILHLNKTTQYQLQECCTYLLVDLITLYNINATDLT